MAGNGGKGQIRIMKWSQAVSLSIPDHRPCCVHAKLGIKNLMDYFVAAQIVETVGASLVLSRLCVLTKTHTNTHTFGQLRYPQGFM